MDTPGLDPRTRFQAVGMLGGAAGAVVLPPMPPSEARLVAEGRFGLLPEPWSFLQSLARGEVPGDRIGPVNHLILSGDAAGLAVRSREAAEAGDEDLAVLLAAVAYRMGAEIALPEAAEGVDPRVRAFVHATRGHEAAAGGREAEAVRLLLEAAAQAERTSVSARARYVGEAATLADGATAARLVLELERAAAALGDLDFEELRGELLMARGGLLMELGSQRPSLLQEAVRSFQKATQALPRRTHPVAYALCHLNVGVAYLAMPMNAHASRLRSAIAVQSLREALEIFRPEEHPELWQAALLNLANALQHLPSSHAKDNLAEAVGHYETLLAHRTERGVARARVLANLGNALAHLGDRKGARPRLREARQIFEGLGDREAVEGIDGVLTEMEGDPMATAAGDGRASGSAETRAGFGEEG